jgi:hypothetical protein
MQPLLSVALIVNVCEASEVGVPVMLPLLARLRPAGNVPLDTVKVYDPLAPLALTVWVPYEVATVPFGRVDGESVIVGQDGAMLYTVMPGQPLASVAVTEKLTLVSETAVPLNTPLELKLNPVGRLPDVTAYV